MFTITQNKYPSDKLQDWSFKQECICPKVALVKCIESFQVSFDLIVTPHVLGEVPTEPQQQMLTQQLQAIPKIVCYVLQNHSRSNALLVDGETRRLKLAPALDPLVVGTHQEKASIVFLQHK